TVFVGRKTHHFNAPEGRRTYTHVDDHVIELAKGARHELRLALWRDGIVQPAQHVSTRHRQIGLLDREADAERVEVGALEPLAEETAIVAPDSRDENVRARD